MTTNASQGIGPPVVQPCLQDVLEASDRERAVREALDQIPVAHRRDYDAATDICPELVQRESPLWLFSRTEDHDAARAAARLVRYWQARRWVFGERRWLFPLNQTGTTGALNADDVALLRTGYHVILPYTHHHAHHGDGPPQRGMVCLHNEGRMGLRPAGMAHVRLMFYMAHVYRECTHHVTVVHVVTGEARPPVEMDTQPWRIFHTAFPIRVRQNIVVQAWEPHKGSLLDFYGFRCSTVAQHNSRMSTNRVAENSIHDTLQQLQHRFGLHASCLPHCLGGRYDYGQHADWIRMRLSVEDVMSASDPMHVLPPPNRTCYRPSAVPQVTQMASVSRRGALVNVAHERARRRHREQQQQRKLRSGTATSPPQGIADDNDDDADVPAPLVKRERNNLYSRRAYQKKKLEEMALMNQRDGLRAQNATLREDNARLEGLLRQAQQVLASVRHNEQNEEPPTTTTTTNTALSELFPSFMDPTSNLFDDDDHIGDGHSLCDGEAS